MEIRGGASFFDGRAVIVTGTRFLLDTERTAGLGHLIAVRIDGNVLPKLREIAVPSEPGVFIREQSGSYRGRGRNGRRREDRAERSCQMRTEETVRGQVLF